MANLQRTQDSLQFALNYTTPQLRSLIEEYIMQQKSSLSLKGACDYCCTGRLRKGAVLLPVYLKEPRCSLTTG